MFIYIYIYVLNNPYNYVSGVVALVIVVVVVSVVVLTEVGDSYLS